MSRKLRQTQGNWVDGERFWGREGDIRILTRMIDDGAHISLVAQRRMGKTSLMKELGRRLSDRYICLFLDLQKESLPADAVAEFALVLKPHEPLWEKGKGLFANVLSSVTGRVEEISYADIGIRLRGGLDSGNWVEKGDALFRILSKSEMPILLMIDELPLLVNRMLRAGDDGMTKKNIGMVDRFMSWLRKNSIEHKGNVRIMLSGSIGLEPLLHQARLSAVINNYQPYDLKPWDVETAAGCLKALASYEEIVFEEDAAQLMVKKLGCCIPHHVQLFFSCVFMYCMHRNEQHFRTAAVDELYEKEMLGLRGHAELTHYEERLSMYFEKDRLPFVKAILTETAISGILTQPVLDELRTEYDSKEKCPDAQLAEMMRILQHDGYLGRKNEGYVFESSLLRDWWIKAHEEFYTRRK